jgi:hypothetical protein
MAKRGAEIHRMGVGLGREKREFVKRAPENPDLHQEPTMQTPLGNHTAALSTMTLVDSKIMTRHLLHFVKLRSRGGKIKKTAKPSGGRCKSLEGCPGI